MDGRRLIPLTNRDGATDGLIQVGGVVVLSGPMLRVALNIALISGRTRRINGLPLTQGHHQLVAALTAAMSASDQVDVREPVALQPSNERPTVTVGEAAKQLDLSTRQVRRLADRLGGQRISGRWWLDQLAIDEHVEGRKWTT